MSLFNDIINGEGHKHFRWVALLYVKNDGVEYLNYFDTYAEALAYRLRHKKTTKIVLELEYTKFDDLRPELIGDEKNWIELQKNLSECLVD